MTEESLRDLAAREGLDFATALLYDRLVYSAEHGPFIECLAALPEVLPCQLGRGTPTVAIVPGACYRENRRTGADGQFLMEDLGQRGYPVARVPLLSFGSIVDNADRLCAWLRQRREEDIILVSLSKAGAEVKLALARPDAAKVFARVSAWVNLSGIIRGTAVVNWLRTRRLRMLLIQLLFWYRGYDFAALQELERGPGRLLDFDLGYPEHMQVIHLVGFPLARHLSSGLARRGYRRLAPLGPNDGGGILLADLRTQPGLIYPVWGADHYMKPAWDVRPLIARVLAFLVLEGQRCRKAL
jgi:hypothetical protein